MNINGQEYVKADTIDKIKNENAELKRENERLRYIIKMLFPIDNEEFERYFVDALDKRDILIRLEQYEVQNERTKYELEIKSLKAKIGGLNSELTKLKKQYKINNDGTINLRKVDENKLLQIKKLVDSLVDN